MPAEATSNAHNANKARAMHVRTPLIHSLPLSALVGRKVLLKLENTQPAGSFKLRGHAHLAVDAVSRGVRELVCSSGGNAGAAVAYAARQLSVRARIVVPTSTPAFMLTRLRELGAQVEVYGDVWDVADEHARKIVDDAPKGERAYVPPFDDERLWKGIATIVEELASDLGAQRPAAIALSVGGGGLFCGTALGMQRVGWADIPILCAETKGAESFANMVSARRCEPIESITSIAKSLGALQVAQECAEWVVKKQRPVMSVVVSDREAVEACSLLDAQHRFLVEPACGAALAAIMKKEATEGLVEGPIVVVVCGGNMASSKLLDQWIQLTGATRAQV